MIWLVGSIPIIPNRPDTAAESDPSTGRHGADTILRLAQPVIGTDAARV
jgi:hypothetical protein